MGKTRQTAAITLAIVVFRIAVTAGQAVPFPGTSESRLRIMDSWIAELVSEGGERSATLSRLLTSIERTDGLVYVSAGPCMPRIKACLLMQLDQAGPNRMLRIHIMPGRPDDDAIVAIGHELRHAMEVLGDPRVKTTRDMFVLYQRIGLRNPSSVMQFRTHFRFETAAAIQTSEAIRAELADDR
jgi:hypothetical protein